MNNTSILISWSPPWPHPINGYQLTVINSTSGRNQQVEYSVRDDSFVLNNPSGFECNHLSVVVQANTDVGITALKNFKNISFFKGLLLLLVVWCYLIYFLQRFDESGHHYLLEAISFHRRNCTGTTNTSCRFSRKLIHYSVNVSLSFLVCVLLHSAASRV